MNKIIRYHFVEINSTNTWAKDNLNLLSKDKITLVTAQSQTAGRGRFKRQWISTPNKNINATFCCYVPHVISTHHIPQLMAFAIAKLLEKNGLSPELKWPNDILINGKKIAGILCETISDPEGIYVITGAGLNVNMDQQELSQIDRPTTSMLLASGKEFDIEELLTDLQLLFLPFLETFFVSGFTSFIEEYRSRQMKNKQIHVKDGNTVWEGTYQNINEDGSLTMLLKDGSIKILFAGEIE